jgi:cell division protein FtsN
VTTAAVPAPKPAPAPEAKPAAAPAAKPAPKPAPVVVGPATAPPRSLAAAPAPKPAEPVKTAAASGSVVLQIGAYKSQADADASWKTYRAKHAALLDGYNSDVQQADLGDKGIWYRLRIAGFASKDVASALCERLKADGGACFLGK